MTDDSGKHEIIQLTLEALKLGNTAVIYDRQHNYIAACDYYDKCLLNMDEVLNKLHPDSDEWQKLFETRSKYDDRMEALRDNESRGLPLLGPKGEKKVKLGRKRGRPTDTDFREVAAEPNQCEAPPTNLSEFPYWVLRNVGRTIESGGFLMQGVFVPKRVWAQHDVRIQGLGAKVAAFEIITKLVSTHVDTLYLASDEDSLELAAISFAGVSAELAALQTQLSKPFPYIKERPQEEGEHRGRAGYRLFDPAHNLRTVRGVEQSNSKSPPPPMGLTSLLKNVRKYAEVGFQRLVVALPSKLTLQELAEYTALLTRLCEKCQVFHAWYSFIRIEERQRQGSTPAPLPTPQCPSPNFPPSPNSHESVDTPLPSADSFSSPSSTSPTPSPAPAASDSPQGSEGRGGSEGGRVHAKCLRRGLGAEARAECSPSPSPWSASPPPCVTGGGDPSEGRGGSAGQVPHGREEELLTYVL
eukprot:CAMPEP_0173190170 /NCGR_PEP_ID=MMETSP1141-20130122/12199_1 /TAXON_ID=483371 /ORGANISM="non described non described, Strain CCMP2298" /LENGTH=469 /DNA_ID=CAMNT_0014114255 /DNA_START=157 /DNA_END=1565 /DNA_ORIENTATION=-